jgi:hypothetical protein
MSSVRDRIELLTDLLLAAAFADRECGDKERAYVGDVLQDLLSTRVLPDPLRQRIERFDPEGFDLQAAVRDFALDPPMSRRRLMELAVYVTLSDGQQNVEESAFLRELGQALGLAPSDYTELTSDRIRLRHSFIDLARVPLPGATTRA